MYREYLEDFIINENESVYKAGWQFLRNGKMLMVVDDEKKYKGIVGTGELKKSFCSREVQYVKEICNSGCTKIVCNQDEDFYAAGRNIFAEKDIYYIPVIDQENNIIDMFSRQRAFFAQAYRERRLKRMAYADCIYNAANSAKQLGMERCSVIEFGVAGGNGLVEADYYAREFSRLLGIEIEVYGFDNAAGLPAITDYRKEPADIFYEGLYNDLDIEQTRRRLRSAKLIIGDVAESLQTFVQEYHPAPIGAMFVDVDQYASTCPILSFLEKDEELFLPRMEMYFDDVNTKSDSIGEHLAILEFNRRNEDIKILPEDVHTRMKTCFRYLHPAYRQPNKSICDTTLLKYSYYTI